MNTGVRGVMDIVSFVKARKAQKTADLAGGDVTSLQGQTTTLAGQFSSLYDDVHDTGGIDDRLTALEASVTALITAFNAHTHPYTDVDNTGATLNKNTSTKN